MSDDIVDLLKRCNPHDTDEVIKHLNAAAAEIERFRMVVAAGIEWWNSCSESERAYWLERADTSIPAEAYAAFRAAKAKADRTINESKLAELTRLAEQMGLYESGISNPLICAHGDPSWCTNTCRAKALALQIIRLVRKGGGS